MAGNFWRCSHYLEWLLDKQDVLLSRLQDIQILGSEEEYHKLMMFFVNVIQAFGRCLEVRQQVIATAIVYFRRFYGRTPLKSIDPWLMASSCLFLASKVEEFGVLQPKSLVAACCKVVNNQYSKYFKDYNYPYRTHDIFECEFILMEAMDCSLIVFLPYRPLLRFCEDLRAHLHGLADEILERSWGFVNDSFQTDLCLHYPPFLIALGCIELALISLVRDPPVGSSKTSTEHHPLYLSPQHPNCNLLDVAQKWFSEMDAEPERVLEVTRQMLSLYDLWDRVDVDSEMPILVMQKMPRPVLQQSPHHHQQQHLQSGSTSASIIDATSVGNGNGGHHRIGQPLQPHHLLPHTAGGGPPIG